MEFTKVPFKSDFYDWPCTWKMDRFINHGDKPRVNSSMIFGGRGGNYFDEWKTGKSTLEELMAKIDDPDLAEAVKAAIIGAPTFLPTREELVQVWIGVDHDGNYIDCPRKRADRDPAKIAFGAVLDWLVLPPSDPDEWDAGRVDVIDLKLGRKKPTNPVEVKFYAQAGKAYAEWIGCEVTSVRFSYYMGLFGQLISYDFIGDSLECLHQDCLDLIEDTKAAAVYAIPGEHCHWGDGCQFLGDGCPIYPSRADDLPVPAESTLPPRWSKGIITPRNVQQVGKGMAWLEKFYNDGRKHLADYIKKNGSVPVSDGVSWHLAESDNDSWQMQYALAILLNEGLSDDELASVLSIDKVKLDAMGKKRPDLVKRVYAAARMPRNPRQTLKLGKV